MIKILRKTEEDETDKKIEHEEKDLTDKQKTDKKKEKEQIKIKTDKRKKMEQTTHINRS